MVVINLLSMWDVFILSTFQSIVHCSPSISLFILHQWYQFILNPHLSWLVLSSTQNSSAAYSVPYRAFKNSEYILFWNFLTVVIYFMYRYGSILANISSIIPSNFYCVLMLVSYFCKKVPVASDVSPSLFSLASIMHKNTRPCIDTVRYFVSYFCAQICWRIPSTHTLPLIDIYFSPRVTLDMISLFFSFQKPAL